MMSNIAKLCSRTVAQRSAFFGTNFRDWTSQVYTAKHGESTRRGGCGGLLLLPWGHKSVVGLARF